MIDEVEEVLNQLGLSAREVKVYLYLSKSGAQKAIEISKDLKIHKMEVYRFLKNLQGKGLVEFTLERPTRFKATPFEQVLDSLISRRRRMTKTLEEQKETILSQWKAMKMNETSSIPERFVVISGRENVYLKILNLIQRTQKEILGITTDIDLLVGYQDGFLSQSVDEAGERQRDVQLCTRILTQITNENIEVAVGFSQKLQRNHFCAEIRHIKLDAKFALRLAVRDNNEAVILLTPRSTSIASRDESALWTDSKAVVFALQMLFEEMWKDSTSLTERVNELQKKQP